MKRKDSRRNKLFTSVLSLLLCVAMLAGTTFAWFTDSVSSNGNTIIAGNLDVKMYWAENMDGAVWHDAEDTSNVPFDYDKWEPGYTQIRYVKIVNEGNLALKYSLTLGAVSSVGKLAEVIGVYYAQNVIANVVNRDLTGMDYLGLLKDTMNGGEAAYGNLMPGEETVVAVAMKMDTHAGNAYQNQFAGEFVFRLLATQEPKESDSFGVDYDADAGMMGSVIHYSVSENVSDKAANGVLTNPVTVGAAKNDIFAQVPDGVKLEADANALALSVDTVTNSKADVKLEDGEISTSLDIHMKGVAEDNGVPMLVTLKGLMKTGLNATSVAMYHVQNGETIAMTLTADPKNHNEFSYDPATGDVVIAVASFSEYVAVVDNKNLWEGTANTDWYNDAATEFTLTTAEQLAGFGVLVDSGNTFKNKTVNLGKNIDLGGKISFNPIGCGYVNGTSNSGGKTGAAFMGTFDGNGHTILGLYQNGWELGLSYCNLGGGLFASVCDATIQNLVISDAYVVMECVEMGIVAGLSQGDCTYKNISVYNSKIANYQRATGGLIGEVSPGANGGGITTIENVTISSNVVVGSLWGDFDCPVGGVIGARWDDSDQTQIKMDNVTVAARLDVYNDVTSTYQWYAYRRAGMLVGNTDMSRKNEKGTNIATADFLECTKVTVYYAPWVNYHYCQFTNYKPSWPWVRVEAGENCDAYSNPRYGVPNDINGNKVTDAHTEANHQAGDSCRELIAFNQLYGGGQGVYGWHEHEGVDVINYQYSITYINDEQVLAIRFIAENEAKNKVKTECNSAMALVEKWAEENIEGDWEFGGWMNAGSTKLTEIDANNTKDIVLYPYFNKPYTARFVDQSGNVLTWCLFHDEDLTKLGETKDLAQSQLPKPGVDFEFDYWEVHYNGSVGIYNEKSFANYKTDVTIYPVYRYTGNLKLTPVDENRDGTIDYYKVEAVDTLNETTVIPGNVNGVPVKLVEKLYENEDNTDYASGVKTIIIEEGVQQLAKNSLAYTSELDTVKLPSTITTLGKNTFSRNYKDDTKVITIEFNGTMAEWQAILNNSETPDDWHNGLRTGTKVICTDGYYELKYTAYTSLIFQSGKYEWSEHPNS